MWRSAPTGSAAATRVLTSGASSRSIGSRWRSRRWKRSATRAPLKPGRAMASATSRLPGRADGLLLVADAVDGTRLVVGDEHRAVRHHHHVHRPSPRLVARDVEEALDEHLVVGHLRAFDRSHHHAVAALLRAVPGAVLGDEDPVA